MRRTGRMRLPELFTVCVEAQRTNEEGRALSMLQLKEQARCGHDMEPVTGPIPGECEAVYRLLAESLAY